MKTPKQIILIAVIAVIAIVGIAADHIDAPAVQGGTSDITDYFAFQGADNNNLVFVASVQGLLSPASTGSAAFDENTLIEFNIDNDGDFIEDLVIQATARDGVMYFFGPNEPSQTGLNSTILADTGIQNTVDITSYGENAIIENNGGMSFFAGPRDDPFFMDFAQFTEIVTGNATSFNDPGSDTFAGTNVLSIVVEVPKSMLNGTDSINTWVETKRRQ